MREQVSAFMDNELTLEDAPHLVLALQSNADLAEAWSTYHLIGDALRNEGMLHRNLKASVLTQLHHDSIVVLAPAASASKRTVKPSVTWSVAASVAAVMFVGWMALRHNQIDQGFNMQMAHNNNSASSVALTEVPAEYLQAHQSLAGNYANYSRPDSYINASVTLH